MADMTATQFGGNLRNLYGLEDDGLIFAAMYGFLMGHDEGVKAERARMVPDDIFPRDEEKT